MRFLSTRNKEDIVLGSEAILKGISNDGGLYIPEFLPNVYEFLDEWKKYNYNELTVEILSLFFHEFSYKDLEAAVSLAYDNKFDVENNVMVKAFDNLFFLELYHGPTSAFKDMALCLLPHLMNLSSRYLGDKKQRVILTATSGDTGKAALEGFKCIEDFKVIVFYPKNGVSKVQEKQMLTSDGNNSYVVSIEGNFDDAQNGVKSIFMDEEFRSILSQNNIELSSANSINVGRLIPQIVYYFYGYLEMVRRGLKLGDMVDISVPTGNFGNILAGYMAKKMGLPINLLICGSNKNNVLSDFFQKGEYNKNRDFYLTTSPSMDILISSNLERYLYYLSNGDGDSVSNLMNQLSKDGKYKITEEMKEKMTDFRGLSFSDEEVGNAINYIFKKHNYLMDTHTAIGYLAGSSFDNKRPLLVVSTASPYKFSEAVYEGLFGSIEMDEFDLLNELSQLTNTKIPLPLVDLEKRVLKHNTNIKSSEMKNTVKSILGV